MSHVPVLPFLHYSTWGQGFYCEHWLTAVNCWMYGVIKLVEENIVINESNRIAFERLCASDYMFVYEDPKQQELARELFLQHYTDLVANADMPYRDNLSSFPLDPFQSVLIYVSLDERVGPVDFQVVRLDHRGEETVYKNVLKTQFKSVGGIQVHFQYFMFKPGLTYRVNMVGGSISKLMVSPEFGLPFYPGHHGVVRPKYHLDTLIPMLDEIWGPNNLMKITQSEIPLSKPISTRMDIERVLAGRKVLVCKKNKEFYSLARFQTLTPFTISCVIDDSGGAYDDTNSDASAVAVLRDIREIETHDFDAIIFTSGLNHDTELSVFEKLIWLASLKGIPVLSLYDDILQYDFLSVDPASYEKFYVIGLLPPARPLLNAKPNWVINNKVLAVFGTDSVQGKFTTQLYLREGLKQRLSVAHWSTEPTGPLLGADIGYSRCYGSHSLDDQLCYERSLLEKFSSEVDLIITGGQNSIIFEPPGKSRKNNSSTHIFNRFLPRYVVLTVSVDTPVQSVLQAVSYIQELANTHHINTEVVALVMLEGRKVKGAKWTETGFMSVDHSILLAACTIFFDATSIPVFLLPRELDPLCDHVTNILSMARD